MHHHMKIQSINSENFYLQHVSLSITVTVKDGHVTQFILLDYVSVKKTIQKHTPQSQIPEEGYEEYLPHLEALSRQTPHKKLVTTHQKCMHNDVHLTCVFMCVAVSCLFMSTGICFEVIHCEATGPWKQQNINSNSSFILLLSIELHLHAFMCVTINYRHAADN